MLTEYVVVGITTLPEPKPFREDCMKRRPDRCECWYHAVDWRRAQELAIGILSRLGPVIDREEAREACLGVEAPDTVLAGLWSLFVDPIIVSAPRPGGGPLHYINGQHRIRAMLDQHVAEVVVEQNPPRDPRIP